jgi:hypothetical protein
MAVAIVNMIMETLRSSLTSVFTTAPRRKISEDNIHHRLNYLSQIMLFFGKAPDYWIQLSWQGSSAGDCEQGG